MVGVDDVPRRNAMLIITRKPGQRIMLGDDVTIEVISVSGSSVRIGIAAPRSVPVYREEIWSAVKEEGAGDPAPAPDPAPADSPD
jgi:carbon storage regulator